MPLCASLKHVIVYQRGSIMQGDSNSRRHFLTLSAALAAAAGTRSSVATTATSSRAQAEIVCVLGASGMVGNEIVRELQAAGYRVVAVSRDAKKLAKIREAYGDAGVIETLQGDVSSDELAQKLRSALLTQFGAPHAVVASLSSREADGPRRILDSPTNTLRKAFDTNFFSHVIAARGLIPALADSGVYVGINGGLADFPGAGMGPLSITQSALRTLYEVLAQEGAKLQPPGRQAYVRVLGLYGLVATGSATPDPQGRHISGRAIGQLVKDIIRKPERFPGPALSLKGKAYS
jgi:NAD(P)-dependent dehydrogenase (short-subunit alcohol dehydrogenase family)